MAGLGRNRQGCNGNQPTSQTAPGRLSPGCIVVASEQRVNLANLITLGRIILVPVVVWAIVADQLMLAFVAFVVAGVSDAIDGVLAKRFGMATELGAHLDPVADKALLMSIYVALAIEGHLPRWVAILVVSRDIMIVGAVLLSWVLHKPVTIRPLLISKLNTTAQIVLAAVVLASLGLGFDPGYGLGLLLVLVGALTTLSAAAYFAEWTRHMAT